MISNFSQFFFYSRSEHVVIHVPYHVHTDHVHYHHIKNVPIIKQVPVPIVKEVSVPYPVHVPVHHIHQEIPVPIHQYHQEIPVQIHQEIPLHHEISLHPTEIQASLW